MKRFEDFTADDLQQLRNEITLNSLYVSDYQNSFGISANSVCDFFDGFMSFISEMAKDDNEGKDVDLDTLFLEYDHIDNLLEWYYCHDNFDWVEYDDENDDE